MLDDLGTLVDTLIFRISGTTNDGRLKTNPHFFLVFFSCGQNEEGNNQDSLRIAAVLFMHLFDVMLLLTLLLFSLGWGFIRQSLRFKEGWLVSYIYDPAHRFFCFERLPFSAAFLEKMASFILLGTVGRNHS